MSDAKNESNLELNEARTINKDFLASPFIINRNYHQIKEIESHWMQKKKVFKNRRFTAIVFCAYLLVPSKCLLTIQYMKWYMLTVSTQCAAFLIIRICSSFGALSRHCFYVSLARYLVAAVAFDVHSLWSNDIWYLLPPYCCVVHIVYHICALFCVCTFKIFYGWQSRIHVVCMFWYVCLFCCC